MNLSKQLLRVVNEQDDWATNEFGSITANDEGAYFSVVEDAPYTARTAEAKAEELYPEGVPGMDPEEFAEIDWYEIADDWNSWAKDEGRIDDDEIEASRHERAPWERPLF